MVNIYGIKNCDTMKKAFRWLDENEVDYVFHDYKKKAIDTAQAQDWIDRLGWESVINKRGTTWRKLEEDVKLAMNDERAIQMIIDQPSMIKRPLMTSKNTIYLGFSADDYATHLLSA